MSLQQLADEVQELGADLERATRAEEQFIGYLAALADKS